MLARKVIDIQHAHNISPETMRVSTRSFSVDPNWKKKWLVRIDDAETKGYLNQDWFRVGWSRSMANQFDIASRDTRSEVAFELAFSYFYPNAGIENFWRSNPYWFVKELAVEGQVGIVSGERGYGKTDHALFLCELLIRLKQEQLHYLELGKPENSNFYQIRRERRHQLTYEGFAFGESSDTTLETTAKKEETTADAPFSSRLGLYDSVDIQIPTNISISPKSPYAKYFPRAGKISEFVIEMCKGAKAGKFSLPLPDELGFSFNKRRAMTKQNFGIEQLLILIRKFNAGLLAIAQSVENQLPLAITGSAQTRVEKTSKETALYDVRGFAVAQRVRNIPRTSIYYATRAFAPFEVDVMPGLLVEHVAEMESKARDDEEEWTDDMMYDAAIEFVLKNRLTPEEIASGKSGILRGEVRWMAGQIDPESGRHYTVERIAREMEVEVDKVREILAEDQKEAKGKREAKKAKAGYSAPPVPLAGGGTDSGAADIDDDGNETMDGGSEDDGSNSSDPADVDDSEPADDPADDPS